MNDSCEIWNLPWHALQRNLARGIAKNSMGFPVTTVRVGSGQIIAGAGNSWLSRAHRRALTRSRALP